VLFQLSYIPTGEVAVATLGRRSIPPAPGAGPNGTTGSARLRRSMEPSPAPQARLEVSAVLWLIRLTIGPIIRLVPAGAAVTLLLQLRREQGSWGLDPADAQKVLAGDDLVDDAGIIDTRTILVDAPPATVWPWLAQLGYGRGGWYSYDRLDMKGSSADRILPEFQDLAAGDIVPTHPGGGFEARIVEPERALVVYLDDKMVREQALVEAARHPEIRAQVARDVEMPAFRVSWAFILQAEPLGGTRLVERVRADIDLAGPQRRGLPVLGVGLFTLLRSQMLGIQRRAEGASRRSA
jgi:hypothetical protein